jgi:hypothetical protein
MDEPTRRYNTHTQSPAWKSLCDLFRRHSGEFTRLHAQQRYPEKFHIGIAMWNWMRAQDYVPAALLEEAQKVHYRPTKEKDGLPLWRLAFKQSARNTPEIDALFDGKRRGPTPQYARLAEAGVVTVDPAKLGPPLPEVESHLRTPPIARYTALHEWVAQEEGSEWLYIFSTTREIGNMERHNIEPLLKIGSSRGHYSTRIAQQAGSTAAGTTLVCLHAYRVRNSRQAESSVHHALKLQGKHVKDAPGIEWFEIRPAAAHALVEAICGGVKADKRPFGSAVHTSPNE